MKELGKIYLGGVALLLFGCISGKKLHEPCESSSYAYEVLEVIPAGYEHAQRVSRDHADILSEATAIVNEIINGDKTATNSLGIKRLVPIIFPVNLEKVKCDGIPVYFVENANFPPCEVPHGKKAIVVDEKFPLLLSKSFHGNGVIDSLGILQLSHLLAICLLHELGHIANKDYTKTISFEDMLRGDSTNLEKTVVKGIEQMADDFAAFEILYACQDNVNFRRRAVGQAVVNSMKMVRYNLEKKRDLAIKKSVDGSVSDYFKDKGFTHTNLELRFLQIEHMASMSQVSGASIQGFTDQRNSNGHH